MKMLWYSSNNIENKVSFTDAVLTGMPEDGGLWLPVEIPKLSAEFISNINHYSMKSICCKVLEMFLYPDLSQELIRNIVTDAFNFKIPVYNIDKNEYIIELYHGPTMAFKDFGARVMALIFQYLLAKTRENYHIIVATSGDTGSAVANAFSITDIPVTVFYPSEGVSYFQEQQITKYGKNITCLEVKGTFDDCQKNVKQLLKSSSNKVKYITANSINITRLLPQMLYYFISYAGLKNKYTDLSNYKIIYSIPSGNLGNVTAGIISKLCGLPIDKFIISTNENNSFLKYLQTQNFTPCKTKKTVSNAMDVGNPSNMQRIIKLLNYEQLINIVDSYSVSDKETLQTINYVYHKYNYLIDPHTSVGYYSINKLYPQKTNEFTIKVTLSTASPYKFLEVVNKAISTNIKYPNNLKNYLTGKQYKISYKSNNLDIISRLINTKTLVLIGMPGSGKSTIGSQLKDYGWYWIDTDDLIINKYQKPLIEIVNQHGDYFRTIEQNAIKSILSKTDTYRIISTGGSVVYSEESMSYLMSLGIIIYLDVSFEDIIKRISNFETRGIFIPAGETFRDVYNNRKLLYQNYSNMTINNSILNIKETTKMIDNLKMI